MYQSNLVASNLINRDLFTVVTSSDATGLAVNYILLNAPPIIATVPQEILSKVFAEL